MADEEQSATPDERVGYTCLTAFEEELGNAYGGSRIFESVEDLRENCGCVNGCGIVKVAVRTLEVVQARTRSGAATHEGSIG